MSLETWLDSVRFSPDGLVPVVTQDSRSGDVLTLAWADRRALEQTLASGLAHYAAAPIQQTSEPGPEVTEVRLDCDGDAVLYRVRQTGAACHSGERTCFHSRVDSEGSLVAEPDPGGHLLHRLNDIIRRRAERRPTGSYTVSLLDRGVPKAAQKVGEEAVEVAIAATAESEERVASEAADLLYHLLVLLKTRDVDLDAVWTELETRFR
ncbi:MAG: phosphoribosyl-ATP diphosphatase [Gemmatimonadales bacterium]